MHKTLSALVVHDIKNVLALLEIDLEQLNHHQNVPDEGARAYRRCVELKNRLISFLTLYKYDQDGLKPMLTEVELIEFIEDIVSNSQAVMSAATHHGHQIVVRVAAERIQTKGSYLFDENLVELAIESALNNALRYARHQVDVWFEMHDKAVVFKVQDDGAGIGIEDDLMQRQTCDKSSSTGLGLALCKAVAEVHGGGSVSLENLAGGGALFSMVLRSAV